MKRISICLALLGSLFWVGCCCPVATREVVTRLRDVDDFTGVAMESVGSVTVAQGDRFEVSVTADSRVVNRVQTVVEGDVLHVRLPGGWFNWGLVSPRNIQVAVTMPVVDTLRLTGLGSLEATGLRSETLAVQLAGTGTLRLRGLNAEQLLVQHTGVGRCEVDGQVGHQVVQLTGAGRYDAEDLRSSSASLQTSGVGQIMVWVTETLDATISGAGSIEYWGEPEVTEHVSGVGRVRSLGARE